MLGLLGNRKPISLAGQLTGVVDELSMCPLRADAEQLASVVAFSIALQCGEEGAGKAEFGAWSACGVCCLYPEQQSPGTATVRQTSRLELEA